MASRIRGIVVEIGGNTGPLEKALKDVNSTISKTQSQLKDVDKLLKLDPTNTELLNQKQGALKDSISATQQKLEMLKEANEKATKSAENYDAWKKKYDPIKEQIEKTQKKIVDLKDEQAKCESAIAAGVKAKKHYAELQNDIERCKRYVSEYKKEQDSISDTVDAVEKAKNAYGSVQEQIDDTKESLENLKKEQEAALEAMKGGDKDAENRYNQLQAEITKTEDALKELTAQQEELDKIIANDDPEAKAKYDAIQAKIDELTTHYNGLEAQAKDTEEVINKGELAKQKYDALQSEIDDTTNKLNDLREKAKAVDDEFGNPIPPEQVQAIRREIAETEQALARMTTEAHNSKESIEKLGQASEALENLSEAVGNIGSALYEKVTQPIVNLGKSAIETAADFEAGMSRVASVSDMTQEELEAVTAKAREMGRETVFSANEATDAFYYMGIAGWDAQEQMAGIEGVMNAAAAGGTDLARTSDIITDALTAFGESADQSNRFANVLVATMKNSNTDIDKLGESFRYAATTAGALGFSVEDTGLALGLMANSSIKSGQAGNQLKNAMTNLIKPTKAQAEAMVQLGYISQETFKEIDFSKVEKAEAAVAKAQNGVENAQMNLNAAIEKYGNNSTQAAKAANALENAQITLQTATNKLATEQDGVSKKVNKNNQLMTNADGSMKSLKEIMDALRVTLNKTGVDLVDAEGNTREFDDIIKDLTQSEEGLTQAKQLEAVATIFGKRNMAGMLAIVNASDEKYNELANSIYNSCWEVEKLSEELQNSNINWKRYSDKSWAAGKDTETICTEMGSDIAQMIQKTGTGAEDLQKVVKNVAKQYGMTTADARKAVDATMKGMENSSGEAEKTAGKMIDNLNGQITLLKDALADLGIEFGNILMPKIKAIVQKIREVVEWFAKLDDGTKKTIVRVAAVVAAIGPALLVFSKLSGVVSGVIGTFVNLHSKIGVIQDQLASGTGMIGKLFGGLGTSIGQVLGKIMPVVAIIGVLVAAFKHLWDTNDKFRKSITKSWGNIKKNLGGTIEILKDAFGRLAEALKPVIEGAGQVWDGFCNAIAPAFTFVTKTISNFTLMIKRVVGDIVKIFESLAKGDLNGAFDALGKLFEHVFKFIRITIRNFLYDAKKIASSAIDWVKKNVSKMLENAPDFVKQIVDRIGGFIGGITKFIGDVVEDIRTLMKFDNLQEALEYLWTCISVRANDAWVDLCTWAKNIWPTVLEWAGKAWDFIVGIFAEGWERIKGVFSPVIEFFTNLWNTLMENPQFKAAIDAITGAFTTAWNTITTVFKPLIAFFDDLFTLITGGSALAETEDGISGPFSRSHQAITELWEKVKGFFEGIWNDISQNPVLATVGNCISTIFTGAWNLIKNSWETVTGFFAEIWNAINSDDVLAGLGTAISGLFNGAWNNIKIVWETVTGFFENIWNGLMQNETFKGLASTISGVFTTAWNTISELWNTVTGYFEEIWNKIHDNPILGTIADTISAPLVAAWTTISTLWDTVAGYFTTIWQAITGDASLTDILTLIVKPFTDAWAGIKAVFTGEVDVAAWFKENVWDKITGVFANVGEAFKDIGKNMWDGLTGFFNDLGDGISNFFTEKIVNPIVGTFTGIKDKVTEAAGNIWDGFTGGISSGVDAAKNATVGFFGNVWGGVTDFFGIQSPSKKAAEAGGYLMEGFTDGAEDNKDSTKKSLVSVFEEVNKSMLSAIGLMEGTAKTLEKQVVSLATVVGDVLYEIDSATKKAVTEIAGYIDKGAVGVIHILDSAGDEIRKTTDDLLVDVNKGTENAMVVLLKSTDSFFVKLVSGLKKVEATVVDNEVGPTLSAILTIVQANIETISGLLTKGLTAAGNGVQTTMDVMTEHITTAMENAVTTVESGMRRIQESTHFEWNLPNLKLPHINVNGNWSFNPPQVPSFSVQWYKSAMNKGMILNNPTIFGMLNGKLLGAGEAGSETVVGTKSLMSMIRDAVAGMVHTQNVNYGGVTINVYGKEGQDIHALAKEVEHVITLDSVRRRAGFA